MSLLKRSLQTILFSFLTLLLPVLAIASSTDMSANSSKVVVTLSFEQDEIESSISWLEANYATHPESTFETIKNALEKDTVEPVHKLILTTLLFKSALSTHSVQSSNLIDQTLPYVEAPIYFPNRQVTDHSKLLEHVYWKAEVLHSLSRFDQAIEVMFEGLNKYQQGAEKPRLWKIYHSIGIAYFRLGKLDLAKEFFSKSIELTDQDKLLPERGRSLVALAIMDRESDDQNRAIDKYEQALEIFKSMKNKSGQASVYNNMGVIFEDLEQYEYSLANFQSALKIYQELKASDNINIGYLNVSSSYNNLGKYSQAQKYIELAIEMAVQSGNKPILMNAYDVASQIQFAQGEYKQGHELYLKMDGIRDEIKNQEALTKASDLEEKYKNQEVRLRLKESETERRTQRFLISIITLILLFSLTLMFAIYRGQKQKALLYKEVTEKNKLLEQLARKDPLTKIFNRRAIDELMETERVRSIRYNLPFSIVMIDIDHFKTVNDTYGHGFGDEVICKITDVLTDNLRMHDSIGRWGGEEFIILLPNTDLKAAKFVAEKCRVLIEEQRFVFKETQIQITISLGVAERKGDLSILAMVTEADDKLYEAKESGRNSVKA